MLTVTLFATAVAYAYLIRGIDITLTNSVVPLFSVVVSDSVHGHCCVVSPTPVILGWSHLSLQVCAVIVTKSNPHSDIVCSCSEMGMS